MECVVLFYPVVVESVSNAFFGGLQTLHIGLCHVDVLLFICLILVEKDRKLTNPQ